MNTSFNPARIAQSLVLSTAIAMTLAACGGGGSGQASTNTGPSGGSNPAPTGGSGPNDTTPDTGTATPAPQSPIIYVADQTTAGVDELYMVDAAAPGTSIKLNAPLVAGGNVYDYALSPDGQYVTYIADQDIDSRYELYRVSLSNPGAATKLNPSLSVNRDVMDFIQSNDGKRIVYRSDSAAEDFFDLYIVDVSAPGTAVQLSGPLTTGGSVRAGYVFSADDTKVVYRADEQAIDRVDLFVASTASPGLSTKLNGTLVTEGDVTTGFSISPDNARVAYVADQEVDGVLELYAVSFADPGNSQKLNGQLVAGGDVCDFEFSPDSTRVAYCADQDTDEVTELYTTALNAPAASVKLSPPLVAGGNVTASYDFSADSSSIAYLADQEVDEKIELYQVAIATPGSATKLNGALVADGDVWDFTFRPDGSHVGYVATQDDLAVYELYEVALAAPAESTKLSAAMIGAGLWQFEYSADSSNVFYTAEQDSGAPELYQVEIAAPGVATKLNGPLAATGSIWGFINLPGGTMVP